MTHLSHGGGLRVQGVGHVVGQHEVHQRLGVRAQPEVLAVVATEA